MKKTLFAVQLLIGGMFVFPFVYLFQSTSEAALPPSAYSQALLLTQVPSTPAIDQIHKLQKPVIITYRLRGREDLWSLSKRFKTDPFTIRSSNDLDVSVFQEGTVLRIPSQKGTLYEVEKPETLRVISQGYSRGKTLGAAYESEILQANDFPQPDFKDPTFCFKPGTCLFLPLAFKPTGLGLPFRDMHFRRTSSYGSRRHPVLQTRRMHSGVDLAKPYGSPVLTAREGTVTFAGWLGSYGNMIEIRHVIKRKSGTRVLYTRYGHLSDILVQQGQRVRLYQLIGRVGSTGMTTGSHLHFEVRDESGRAANPNNYL